MRSLIILALIVLVPVGVYYYFTLYTNRPDLFKQVRPVNNRGFAQNALLRYSRNNLPMRRRLLLLSVLVSLFAPAVFSYAQVAPIAATTTASTTPVVPLVVATTTTQVASTSPSATTTTQNKSVAPSLLAATAVVTEITTNTTLAPGTYTYDTLVIKSGATLTVQGDPLLEQAFKGVRIEANNIIVEDGARITADQEGYDLVTRGPGAPAEAEYTKGASHGGLGDSATIGTRYGSAKQPITFGSSNQTRGGGAMQLVAHNELTIDGVVSANGGNTSSGGSIWIQTNSLRGHGVIRANGGDFSSFAAFIGPGGGGRVAVYYNDSSFTGVAEAQGGRRNAINSAEDGTVGFFEIDTNTLTTGHAWRFQANDAPHTYANIVASDSVLSTDDNQSITITNFELSGLSKLNLASGHDLTVDHLILTDDSKLLVDQGTALKLHNLELKDRAVLTASPLVWLNIESENVLIEADAKITLEQTGYAAGGGPGSPDDGDYYLGASYGGLGYGTLNPKPTYGSPTEPVDFGSGANQGRGGGALRLTVSDRLVNDGLIDANGGSSSSGGSLWIETKELLGTGRMSANGGLYSFVAAYQVGPGAGGRIAVYYTDAAAWSGVIEAKGGRNPSGTAYAGDGSIVFQQKTFCTANCNSSVLFLPGIMGSRLFEESDVCDSEIKEQERWVSRDECDQLRLSTNFIGQSVNDIYTKPDRVGIVDEAYTFNLYKTFLNTLEDWKHDEMFDNYKVVPYDWRLRLEDILKTSLNQSSGEIRFSIGNTYKDGYLYKTLAELGEHSKTGKVTIVAHSNGGLVAKQFLKTLQDNNDPLANKIDNLILVGVPQTGTPDAVVGVLHGTEIGPGGLVVGQQVTRQLMNKIPFAHHLIPTASYFNGSGANATTPVITFEPGELTTPWATAFGNTITSSEGMYHFLGQSSGRVVPEVNDLNTPAVVDGFLINYARSNDLFQSSWVPNSGIKVYEIAGVGLYTPTGITYFTDKECISRNVTSLYRCTGYKSKLGYRINMTIDGDQTVIAPSALAMSTSSEQIERRWINFADYNRDSVINRKHKDVLEIEDVIDFVANTLEGTSSRPYNYLTSRAPELGNEDRLVFQLHSPLDMSVIFANGNQVSSSTNTVEGAMYQRYGEVQYISLPNIAGNKTLVLNGLATGSFTLEIEQHKSSKLIKRNTYSAVPTGTSTKVKLNFSTHTSVETAVLEVDYGGDGVSDIIYDTRGEVIQKVTYQTLIDNLNKIQIKSPYKQLLLANAKIAQEYNIQGKTKSKFKSLEILALNVLQQQVQLYGQLKLISLSDKQSLVKIIESLLSL